MIDDPLIYLIVERIKHLSSSGINLEGIDCQLNILDQVLFSENDTENGYYRHSKSEHTNYIYRLTDSYLYLDQEDYQSIGIEANIWFLNLISDNVVGGNTDLISSENMDKLANLYVVLEHPYCRYLVMTIYSNLSVRNRNLKLNDFVDNIWNIWRRYEGQKRDKCFKNHDDYNRNESLEGQDVNSEYNEIIERHLLTKEIEAILEDINTKRRKEDY